MGDFNKLSADAIALINKIVDLCNSSDKANDKFAYDDMVSFGENTYKVRVNLLNYPDYAVIEMIKQ